MLGEKSAVVRHTIRNSNHQITDSKLIRENNSQLRKIKERLAIQQSPHLVINVNEWFKMESTHPKHF